MKTARFPVLNIELFQSLKLTLVRNLHIPKKTELLLTIFLIISCMAGWGQKKLPDSFNIRSASFFLPQPLPKGHYSSCISVLYVVTPRDWTDDVITAPMFYYQAKYTLPKSFNVQASLATLFISNRITLGPFWNYKINDNNYAGVGWQVVWNYGILNQFGFSTQITGWEQQPSLTWGHVFGTYAFSVKGNLYWTNKLYFIEGKSSIPTANPFINGYGITLNFDQKLYKNRAFTLGFNMSYLRYHIVAWPAFPVNQKRYWVPEFQFGLAL
jgi:hypothetical protein